MTTSRRRGPTRETRARAGDGDARRTRSLHRRGRHRRSTSRRCRARPHDVHRPDELNEVLARVLRDFRLWTVAHGAAVRWTARLLVPLKDGTYAEIDVAWPGPLPSVLSTRTPDPGRVANAAAPNVLAGLFFDDGLSLQEIGELRGIDGSGYNKSFLGHDQVFPQVNPVGLSEVG